MKYGVKESDPFYHSAAWKKARKARLMMDGYMCVQCMAAFEAGGAAPRPATMVHHIIPITERPDLALDLGNMQSLCDVCHNRAHPEKGGQGRAARRTTPAVPMRIIKV